MTTEQIIWSVVGTLVVAVFSLAGVIYTARIGRRATEQSSQVEFSRLLLERVKTLEAGQTDLWAAREQDALVKRAAGDHIDVLEQHIWSKKPPPPPPRPAGI